MYEKSTRHFRNNRRLSMIAAGSLPALARAWLVGTLVTLGACAPMAPPADPLPSWNDGKAKQSIVAFVAKVTTPGSPDFVPIPERIATFDNDGTLWAEQPMYFQLVFALDRVKALDAAQAGGGTVVDMKQDWNVIFPFQRTP